VDQIKLSVLNKDDKILNHITYWSVLPFLNRIIIIFNDEQIASQTLTYLRGVLKPYDYLKLSLQENLLQRSKSQDQIQEMNSPNSNLNVTKSLANFRTFHNDPNNESNVLEYVEPAPAQFNVLSDLSKLGIDLRDYNSDEQLNELKEDELEQQQQLDQERRSKSPGSLSPMASPRQDDLAPLLSAQLLPVLRRRSTKTLFRPSLKVKTGDDNDTGKTEKHGVLQSPAQIKLDEYPQSPTITLDETF